MNARGQRDRLCRAMGACLFSLVLGCGHDDLDVQESPLPLTAGVVCQVSADCAAGLHCDLGECLQDCNSEKPCDRGKVCSARARCLAPGQQDRDPVPASSNSGTVSVTPSLVRVRAEATEVVIALHSSAAAVVNYRIVTELPFLMVSTPRGSFKGLTELRLGIDSSKLGAESTAGTVRILTDLGEQVVQVVSEPRFSGKYQGSLHYDTAGVRLGDARLGLELLEANGEVDVLIDPDMSLLFPPSPYGAPTGFGTLEGDKLDLTVAQRLADDVGGERNHFARPLGRNLTFELTRTKPGWLEGRFREKLFGLFEQPVELEGTVSLHYRAGEAPPDFELSEDTPMPPFRAPPLPLAGVLGGNTEKSCVSVLKKATATWASDRELALSDAFKDYYARDDTMVGRFASGTTYGDLLEVCEAELLASPRPAPDAIRCAWLPALACGAYEATGGASRLEAFPARFNDLFAATLAPPLLIAQEYAVQALDSSFAPGGLAAERDAYAKALAALTPVATWSLHPALLDFMRQMSPEEASGELDESAAALPKFRAARALAQLLSVYTIVDGERTRLDGIDAVASSELGIRRAQERAVLSLYEAAVLVEITRAWGTTPERVAADLSGYLTPLDSAFGALLEGAQAFGVPTGFVPFVWRAEDAGQGATNFEQTLLLSVDSRRTEEALESAYLESRRSFENSESTMLHEALSVQLNYDAVLSDICGPAFEIEAANIPVYWAECGKNDSGELGALLLDIKLADEHIRASQSRLQGLYDKLKIDQMALAQSQNIRIDTMTFVSKTDQTINGLALVSQMLGLTMDVIAVAANSSLFNGGAPAAMAAGVLLAGIEKAGIDSMMRGLESAKTMEFMRQDASLELVNGMANIKKQIIDIAQLTIEIAQDALVKRQSLARAQNALERAKGVYQRRAAVLAAGENDPTRDPTFRLLRDSQALRLIDARSRAQRSLYLAARALEYEVNTPLSGLADAVLRARSSQGLNQLANCLGEIQGSYRLAFGTPQRYVTDVSVREMLGIFGTRTDSVTKEVISPGEQFRRLTQVNQAFDANGSWSVTFSTNLQPGNGLWSDDVCADRIVSVQAQLVGDKLGDNDAQVNFALGGAAVLATCESDELRVWSMAEGTSAGSAFAVVQAGVNSFGTTGANNSLFGQSVARATWQLTVPGGNGAPANVDVDLSGLEDIVLRVEHQASPRRATPLYIDTSCLMGID